MEVHAFGVKIDSHDFDLCTQAGVTCPVKAGEKFQAKVSYAVPSAAPPGISADTKMTVIDTKGAQRTCLDMKVKIAEDLFGAVQPHHDFTKCGTDHLAITSVTMSPDPPVHGKPLVVTFKGTSDADITAGTAHMEVHAFGVKVDSKDFDLCKQAGLTCPIKAGVAFTASIPYTVPGSAPGITSLCLF